MKTLNTFLVTLLIIGLFVFNSCKKESELEVMINLTQEDDELAGFMNEILAEVDDVSLQDVTLKSSNLVLQTGQSGTRSVVTSFSGDTVTHTVTFANFINPNLQNENTKNGEIIIKVVGRPLQEVFWRRVSFDEFTVNGNLIEGVKQIVKTGQHVYTVNMTNGKITFTDGKTYTREFSRTRTMTEGSDTPYNVWDDVYEIEGATTGVNRNGNSYVHTIVTPLVIRMNCRWITKGIIELSVGDQTATLDYGDGQCDRFATLTYNGESRTIRLRGGRN